MNHETKLPGVRVLVIEDHPDLALGLRNNLEIEGYEVDVSGDGESGLDQARSVSYQLVLLDLMLPGMDGFRVLKTLRDEGNRVPVLILTARGDEADKVRGLRLGGDDYVTKPFSILELLARVEALIRRAAPEQLAPPSTTFEFGSNRVDVNTRQVFRDDTEIEFTPKEFDLLVALLGKNGAVASRVELMETVWGYPSDVLSRTVDTHILELRRKLEDDPSSPRFIVTVRKVGYRFDLGSA